MGSPCTINNILFGYLLAARIVDAVDCMIFDPLTSPLRRAAGLPNALVRPPTPIQRVPFRAPFQQEFGPPFGSPRSVQIIEKRLLPVGTAGFEPATP